MPSPDRDFAFASDVACWEPFWRREGDRDGGVGRKG